MIAKGEDATADIIVGGHQARNTPARTGSREATTDSTTEVLEASGGKESPKPMPEGVRRGPVVFLP